MSRGGLQSPHGAHHPTLPGRHARRNSLIPALVLTAGLATRLRPLSLVRAKAALPVAGEPLIRRLLRALAAAGVSDAVLNLHHLPQTVTAAVGDGSDLGLRVRYSWEMPLLGSAGGPRRAIPLLDSAPDAGAGLLIVNGDTLTDVNIEALVEDHRRSGALITMAAVPNTTPEKYGGLAVAADGTVVGFVRRGETAPSSHFVGVQVAQAEAFASVPPDTPHESVGALYPALMAAQPGCVRAFRTSASFLEIGTPADYLAVSLLLASRESEGATAPRGVRVDPAARVERSILWEDVVVESGVRLDECVVTDGVRVPANTAWHRVTIRRPEGDLAPGERRIGGLAVASLDAPSGKRGWANGDHGPADR